MFELCLPYYAKKPPAFSACEMEQDLLPSSAMQNQAFPNKRLVYYLFILLALESQGLALSYLQSPFVVVHNFENC